MNADEFYRRVESRADLDSREEAEAVTHAVLRTLSERISSGDVQALRTQAPDELASALQTDTDQSPDVGAESFGQDEYVDRVRERLGDGFDGEAADDYARAVHGALSDAVGAAQIEDVESQLPAEFGALFEDVDVESEPGSGGA